MDVTNSVTIDLGKFGYSGEVVMAPPSIRKVAALKNQVAKYGKVDPATRQVTEASIGDIEVLSILAYVKSAPFPMDIDSFYDFCDELEASLPGASVDMFQAMADATLEIDGGRTSPLERLETLVFRK